MPDDPGSSDTSTGRPRHGLRDRWSWSVPRLAVVSVLLILVPLALLTFWSISLSSRSLRSAVNAKLVASAELKAEAVSTRMEGVEERVASFAGLPDMVGNVGTGSTGDLATVQTLVDHLERADPDVSSVGVFGADGRLIAVSPPAPQLVGQDFSDRDWYRGVTRTGEPYVSAAYTLAAEPNPPVIGVAAPIRGDAPDAPVQGFVVAGYRLESFNRFAEEIARDDDFELMVTDQAGVVIGASNARSRLTPVSDSEGIRRALAGESGTLTSGSHLVGYAPVEDLGWAVQTTERASSALAPARDLRWRVVAATVPVGVATVLGLILLIRALAARSRARAELAEQQAYSRSIIESSPDAQFAVDREGVITDVNDEATQLTARTRDELIGTPIATLMTDPDRTRAGIQQTLTTGSVRDYELVARRPDGTTTPLSLNAAILGDDADHQAVLAVARDITEAKRLATLQHEAVEQLRELAATRTDFISRVSHELRSPLTGVLGYTELLDDDAAGPLNSEQRRMVQVIDRNGRRLKSLVEDLLTLSRLEAGTFHVHMATVALPPLVEHAIQGLSPAIEQRHLHIRTDLDDDTLLEADGEQLERAIVNLVSNSVKFTPAGGEVDVSAHRDGGDVVLEVRDTGIGIPPEEQPHVFTRFFRSSLAKQIEAQGTGLGLFIVKQIVDAHHGTIEAMSEPGRGTVMTVRLPVRQPTPAEASAPRGGRREARPRAR